MTKLECLYEIKRTFAKPNFGNCAYRIFTYKNEWNYIDNEWYTNGMNKKHIIKDENGNERIEYREENQENIEIAIKANINILIKKELGKNDKSKSDK